MKVIVTGGAGFIGSNLVRLLLERGHEVLNIDALTYAGNIHSLDGSADSPAYRFLHADVRDASLMRRTLREYAPDWVMHLAAEPHVDRSIDDPGNFMTTNVMGTFSMLQAEANESGAKTLKRVLGAWSLVALGVGVIIGAGLFSITGTVAAGYTGPAITLSFAIAAIGCCFAGLCYAEFASMIPVAGSAYTYSYATM